MQSSRPSCACPWPWKCEEQETSFCLFSQRSGLRSIHHPSEKLSKSTAVHAVIVSPDAKWHESTDIPVYDPKDTVRVSWVLRGCC